MQKRKKGNTKSKRVSNSQSVSITSAKPRSRKKRTLKNSAVSKSSASPKRSVSPRKSATSSGKKLQTLKKSVMKPENRSTVNGKLSVKNSVSSEQNKKSSGSVLSPLNAVNVMRKPLLPQRRVIVLKPEMFLKALLKTVISHARTARKHQQNMLVRIRFVKKPRN